MSETLTSCAVDDRTAKEKPVFSPGWPRMDSAAISVASFSAFLKPSVAMEESPFCSFENESETDGGMEGRNCRIINGLNYNVFFGCSALLGPGNQIASFSFC